MSSAPPKRRIDPRRRDRVIEGVLHAIAEYGVEGLTHRRAAEAAGVSLSSTTYYFATLEEMLDTALRTATERDIAELRERFGGLRAEEVGDLLAAYVEQALTGQRERVVVLAELYIAAVRRPALRELVIAWETAWGELLAPVIGGRADALSAAIGGILLRALVYGDERAAQQSAADLRGLFDAVASDR